MFTPATIAASHPPVINDRYALSKADIELLHAASTTQEGPVSPSPKDIRLAKKNRAPLNKVHKQYRKLSITLFN